MNVIARMVTQEQDGIPGYIAHPEGPAQRPGILMVHHAHGVTADYKIDAYRLAALGFNVLAPSLFNMFGVAGTNHIGAGADLQAKHSDDEFLGKMVEAWRYLTAKSVEELRTALNQLTDPLEVLELGVESIWDSLRRLGDIQLAAFDLLVQAPRTERLRAYLPELFTRYREVIQEQLDRLEEGGIIRLTVPREVLVPLVLNTVLGFGLYYVVTRDDESCLRALSAFNQLAATLVEPV